MNQELITFLIGYTDYERLFRIHQSSAYFVVRAKRNLQYQRMYSNKVNKGNGVLLDQIGKLTGFYTAKEYPEKLRRIKFYDEETDNHLTFLSNNFDLKLKKLLSSTNTDGKSSCFSNGSNSI